MSDLTRDEIRSACEAVGWEWDEDDVSGWAAWQPSPEPNADGEPWFVLLWFVQGDYGDDSAIAILDATGERWQCGKSIGREEPYFALIPGQPHTFGPDLPTAAVRAVNQWTKTKKETTP